MEIEDQSPTEEMEIVSNSEKIAQSSPPPPALIRVHRSQSEVRDLLSVQISKRRKKIKKIPLNSKAFQEKVSEILQACTHESL